MTEFLCSLKNPTKEYRGHPFWSWNDNLVPDELRRQIRSMKAAGLGGFFMHARGGLETEYMGSEWFDCISACVDEAEKQNMEAWSYDENGWPSGFAGGLVTDMGDEYHVRHLICTELDPNSPDALSNVSGQPIAIYTISASGHYRCFGTSLSEAVDFAPTDGKIYCVSHDKNQYYVDLLNKKVVRAFIDTTYELYKTKLGDNFGGTSMPGFFTDEPQFARCQMPWSYVIPEEFEKTNNYSPLEHLICLFQDVLGAEKFRYDFWNVVSRLYTESFGKQIYDWCCENNCRFTGHAMAEDSLFSQMLCTGGVMPLYQYMHVPGIDWLCRGIASPIIPKQVGSAAAQTGRRHVMTETYALTGWDVSFEELKWMAEWQFVNGVNLICAHLEGYTIRGLRKRDYPCTIFEQSPWWGDYKIFNDYISRLGKLLADGCDPTDTLLLHPLHSAWITYNGGSSNEKINSIDHSFEQISNILSGLHIPYHYGDENIIKNLGSAENGKFIIGKCSYSHVILPALETIDESTFVLLDKFAAEGGKIYSMGTLPYRINGRYDSRIKALNDMIITVPTDDELRTVFFSDEGMRSVTVSGKNGETDKIHVCTRVFDNGENRAYFFVNLDRENGYDVKIKIPENGSIVGYRLEDLRAYDTESRRDGQDTYIYMHFEPMQSVLILAGDDIPEVMHISQPSFSIPISNEWTIERDNSKTDLNQLTVDYVQYALGTLTEKENGKGVSITFGGYSDRKPVLGVMDELIAGRSNCPIRLRYTFDIADDFDFDGCNEMYLITEYEKSWKILVNGKEVRHDLISWWKDRTFKKINIRSCLVSGENEIVITGVFTQKPRLYELLFGENVLETELNKLTYETEIESIYLLGNFSVYSMSPYTDGARRAVFTDGGFKVSNQNFDLKYGELVTQGYPFFSGKITLSQNIKYKRRYGERVSLTFTKPYACTAKLYVNGIYVRTFTWADYKADITDYTEIGDNTISFELTVGNRNLFGPHHHPQGELYAVGTKSFGPNNDYSSDSWRSRYCFVKVGMGE